MKRYIKSTVRTLSEEDLPTKRELAHDPNTTPEVLEQLYYDNKSSLDWETRYYICLELAANPNTPMDVLEQLSDGIKVDHRIRREVAANPSTSVDILQKLVRGSGYDVCRAVAENPNVSEKLLRKIASLVPCEHDKDMYSMMLCAVAENLKTPTDILEKLSQNPDHYVRAMVAANPNTPDEVLEELLQDEDYYVQSYLGKNPRINEILGDA